MAQKEIDGLRSAIAEESESNIRTSLQKLAVIPLDTLQAKVKSEGESFLNHLVGANSRNVSDAIWLGECYAHGGCDLVPIDNDKAYKWYKEATSTGDGTALLYLAECLEKGIGCVADKKEAVNYYDRARRADCDIALEVRRSQCLNMPFLRNVVWVCQRMRTKLMNGILNLPAVEMEMRCIDSQ